MPIKVRKHVPTPPFVIWNGWRDKPYTGPDVCVECDPPGSGTKMILIGDGGSRRPVYRTCQTCAGKGHE